MGLNESGCVALQKNLIILDFGQNNGNVARVFVDDFLVTHIEDIVSNKDEIYKARIKNGNDKRKLTKLRKCEGSAIDNELTVKSLPINIIKSLKLLYH